MSKPSAFESWDSTPEVLSRGPAMRTRGDETLESWDLSPVRISPRSRLYRLEPIGVGTAAVEGLTSYVMRLAAAHAVWIGNLVGHELFPGGAPAIRTYVKTQRAYSHGFGGASYWINGTGECSATWIEALERSTFQDNLRLLTLMPFGGAVSERLVLRLRRAWCPDCLEDQTRANLAIYEPLVWGLRIIKVCADHRRPLEEVCPHCLRDMWPLAIKSRPGCCSRCEGWLGTTRATASEFQATDYDFWLARAMGELLAYSPRLPANSLDAILRRNLSIVIQTAAGGNCAAFAGAVHYSRVALADWLNGRNLARLDILLRICYRLKLQVLDLFTEAGPRFDLGEKSEVSTVTGVRLMRRRGEIKATLNRALTEEPAPALHEVASRIGYRSTSSLYDVDLALCKQITANNRKWRRKQLRRRRARVCSGPEEIRSALGTAFAQKRAFSLSEVCMTMGYVNPSYVRKKFPELSGAISRRFAEQRRARLESLLLDALLEDPPPTLCEVIKRSRSNIDHMRSAFPELCNHISVRWAAFQEKWATDLRESLEAALTENPAPSIRTICKRLDLHYVMLAKMFPDLRAAIRSKYKQMRAEVSRIRREELRTEVLRIMDELQRQGVHPGLNRVRASLSESSLKDWPVLIGIWKQARLERASVDTWLLPAQSPRSRFF